MEPTTWSGYLEFDQVSFSWPNGVNVIDQCSFSLIKPGLWMLVGENGSGKSTLFRLISGVIRPNSGKIFCSLKPSLVYQNPDHQFYKRCLINSVIPDFQFLMRLKMEAPRSS